MLSLQNIMSTEGNEFIENLLNKEVVVTEKLNAATLSFRKIQKSEMDLNRKLTFYKNSGAGKKEITIADKVMTTFFSAGMTYLSNMSNLIIDKIPANWTFVCRYFPNHQPSFINYSVLPKNNLVLSFIVTNSGTKIDDVDDLRSWAEMFDIAYQEPVFRGFLSEYQKEQLKDYIKDGDDGKDSFSRFIITLLNPSLTHSIYQEDGFNSPIDGFIFKFISDDGITKPVSAKLIDPYMSSIIAKNKAKKGFNDNKDVLISDFTIFMSGQDLDSIILTSGTDEDRYLELFYRLFNRYIKYKKSQLEDFDIETNDVVKESIETLFDIDIDNITNETTKKLLIENPEYKNIFKTLLGSFRAKKPENYKSLVMAPNVVRMFNGLVDTIAEKSKNGCENRNMTFSDFLSTIKKKDINTLDINNAPKEVRDEMGIEEPKEIHQREPLSFADFKKKDEKEEKEEKEDKRLKSIEDMIKQLKDSVGDLKNDVKKTKTEEEEQTDKIKDIEKEKGDDSEKKDDDKKDDDEKDKKSEESHDDNEDEKSDNDKDDNEDDNENEDDKSDDSKDEEEDIKNDDNKEKKSSFSDL